MRWLLYNDMNVSGWWEFETEDGETRYKCIYCRFVACSKADQALHQVKCQNHSAAQNHHQD